MKRNLLITAVYGILTIFIIAISCSKESMIFVDEDSMAMISEDAENAIIDEEINLRQKLTLHY